MQNQQTQKTNKPVTPPMVYRIHAAAATLGVSRTTIYRLIDAGKLDRVRITEGAVGIPATSLKNYAESRGLHFAG